MPSQRSYHYQVVDVFTEYPLEGNPLAVFPDAAGLDDGTMQKIAKEMNLSETTFVFPATRPDCVADVRIFAPANEMRFAGHPTIGTSFVLITQGRVPKNSECFVLEEKIGPVPIRVENGSNGRPLIWFATPAIQFEKTYDPALCAKVIGLASNDLLDVPPQMVNAGNPAIFVPIRNKEAVDRASLDPESMKILKGQDARRLAMFPFTPTPEGAYSRMFAPDLGVAEDPASGSLTGPLAALMMRHGLAPKADGTRLNSEQGTRMGRRSILHILVRGDGGADGIDVGGYVTPLVEGTMTLP
jgi:trans-2,3-dihydro-3-hydroxyanthranilate isomerase